MPIFGRKLKHYAKKNPNMKKDYQYLLDSLKKDPTNAIFIKNNSYKIRLKNSSSNRGKSSGYRIYYFYKDNKNTIILLYMYSKNEQSNLDENVLDELIKSCQIIFKDQLL